MSFVLPNPTVPTNGQLGDATPILQNETAIAQAIASFDGSQIQAKSVQSAALADNINPQIRGAETLANFVFTGCIWSLVSGFSGTMTGGTIYVNGFRTIVSGVGANTFNASNDTYVYIDNLGNVSYQAVSNNAASPSAVANAILVAIVVTSGSTITSINQGSISATAPIVSSNTVIVCDTNGNIIYPTDTTSKLVGFRQSITSQSGVTSLVSITGLTACPALIPNNRRVKIGFEANCQNTTANTVNQVTISEDGVNILIINCDTPSANVGSTGSGYILRTPTSGLHVYSAQISSPLGGSGSLPATATSPTMLSIELY